MLTFPLQCFLNDKTIFHINFTCSLTFQMETTSYDKAWRGFQKQNFGLCSTYYLTVPITLHKHLFNVHNRFITINCWSTVHYNISLQRTSLQQYIEAIYRFALRDIVAMKDSLERYLGEISRKLYWYLADLSF